jgi:osomolarity two-component system phosphorelay intermediate protein YPD1
VLDTEVFGQILELDDGDRSFVSAMVNEYFEQVDVTFDQMDQAM